MTTTSLLEGPTPRVQRREEGRERRAAVPRRSFADWTEAPDRPDPVALLRSDDVRRRPDLVPIRYGRMSASPWAFLRGSAAVMAADLATLPRTGLEVQLCGDAHLANFGLFAAPDRRQLFDLNDFDETLRGPFEWDLLRLATSAVVAARASGATDGQAVAVAEAAASGYRAAMAVLSEADTMDVWYHRVEFGEVMSKVESGSMRRAGKAAGRNALRRTSLRAFDKLTAEVDGRRRIVADPPLVMPIPDDVSEQTITRLRELFATYRATLPVSSRRLLERFRGADVAQKVVGVGSVGRRAFIVLLQGGDGEPLLLQVKEAGPSVLEPHLGAAPQTNHGQRVVEGQQLIQGAGDLLLGWTTSPDEADRPTDFYVRQLHDQKGSVEMEALSPKGLESYAQLCGAVLARAHARSGDAAAIAGYLGGSRRFDHAAGQFASRYADRTAADHAQLLQAIAEGSVLAVQER